MPQPDIELVDAKPPVPVRFTCPRNMWDHVRPVFAGEYDVPGLTFATPPRILDVGANVGAFAVWAMQRWPGASVTCYEPNPAAREYLVRNVPLEDVRPTAITVEHEGIKPGEGVLYLGKNNLGEASFCDLGEQDVRNYVIVDCVPPFGLPRADILKVDTEGCEVEIISGYIHAHVTAPPRAVLFEFHRPKDRVALDRLLDAYGYTLAQGHIASPERGTLCYVRSP
jgi:FkbM family methyltransferase